MDSVQKIQEDEYAFPYHHLPSEADGTFTQHKLLYWGYIYLSYIRHVIDHIEILAPKSVLDIGCGDGRLLCDLASNHTYTTLVGIDYSEKALAFARAFGYGKNIRFEYADITKTSLGEFDLVTLIEVVEHIPPETLDGFLMACTRALAQNGRMIITVPSQKSPVNPKHYQHFTADMLEELCTKQGLKITKTEYLTGLTPVSQLLRRVFSNRFFVLNESHILGWLYRFYKRNYLVSDKQDGDRILIIAQRA